MACICSLLLGPYSPSQHILPFSETASCVHGTVSFMLDIESKENEGRKFSIDKKKRKSYKFCAGWHMCTKA